MGEVTCESLLGVKGLRISSMNWEREHQFLHLTTNKIIKHHKKDVGSFQTGYHTVLESSLFVAIVCIMFNNNNNNFICIAVYTKALYRFTIKKENN